MPRSYIKICPICGTTFNTPRVNTTYCKKTCRYRASKFEPELLRAIITSVNGQMQVVDTMPKAVRDFLMKNAPTLLPAATRITAAPSTLSKTDLEIIEREAHELLEARTHTVPQNSEHNNQVSPLIDEEMRNFKVDEQHKTNGLRRLGKGIK